MDVVFSYQPLKMLRPGHHDVIHDHLVGRDCFDHHLEQWAVPLTRRTDEQRRSSKPWHPWLVEFRSARTAFMMA